MLQWSVNRRWLPARTETVAGAATSAPQQGVCGHLDAAGAVTALVSTVAHHSANVVPFPVIRPGVSGGFVSRENETYGSGRIEAILG